MLLVQEKELAARAQPSDYRMCSLTIECVLLQEKELAARAQPSDLYDPPRERSICMHIHTHRESGRARARAREREVYMYGLIEECI